jgi:hypothetical protein
MIVTCHVILGHSRRACSWLFSVTHYILQTTLIKALGKKLPIFFQDILNLFPRDIRTATHEFNLGTQSTIFATCPKCNATHRSLKDSPIPEYPTYCNVVRYGSKCGEPLLRPKKIRGFHVNVPIKPYIVFDIKDWISELQSRPGFEEAMDQSWEQLQTSCTEMSDILQGSIIRNFSGPDGKHFSIPSTENEARYVLAASMDFFNPLGNKQAGKSISIGVITLVCLNLPPDIRYKPENMFVVAIIPGPHEPDPDEMNYFLSPLVDELLDLWSPGVYVTRTHLHRCGRLVRCALVCVVCDLPAARKVGGFASYAHNFFCSVCWSELGPSDKKYSDFNYSAWKWRTSDECRACAEIYQTSVTAGAAQKAFDDSGIRSSDLLRLPYFELPQMVVVDPMHNLFLGLLKTHFINVIGVDNRKKQGKKIISTIIQGSPGNPFPEAQRGNIIRAQKLLESDEDDGVIKKKLKGISQKSLLFVAKCLWGDNFGMIDIDGNPSDPRYLPTNHSKISKDYLIMQCIYNVSPNISVRSLVSF